jgi:small nuclear ribonucleoprotein (snRNP)-like protein
LAKKYGNAVRLLVAQPASELASKTEEVARVTGDGDDHEESWYEPRPEERNSLDICFGSNRFDPIAVLNAPYFSVVERNPWLNECSRLDTVAQFALHLPKGDPQRVEPPTSRKRHLSNTGEDIECSKKAPDLHPFEAIAQSVQGGPLARLQHFRKQRVRIVVRYVNAIRGELSGILVAFDKHMNMILRDAEEIYSMRPVDRDLSNVEIELTRRGKLAEGNVVCADGKWHGKKRRMKHLMVRGDNVVSISLSDQERQLTRSRVICQEKRRLEGVGKKVPVS